MPDTLANPYQTPAAPAAAPGPRPQVLKNPRTLALWACWLLAAATAANITVYLAETFIPSETINDVESPAFLGYAAVALAGAAAVFASAILFLFWKYRAAVNARILDPLAMPVTPGLAVGGYFIPFANLYIPYRAMAGIYRASIGASWLPGLWWTLYLVSTASVFALLGEDSGSDEILPPGDLAHVWMVADVLCTTVSIYLVMRITRAQSTRFRQETSAGGALI